MNKDNTASSIVFSYSKPIKYEPLLLMSYISIYIYIFFFFCKDFQIAVSISVIVMYRQMLVPTTLSTIPSTTTSTG